MATRTDRVEARLAHEERDTIRQAAELSHASLSSFMVSASLEKAERVLSWYRVTAVPSDYFDRLQASLDDPTAIPELERAAKTARTNPHFVRS